ncbi:RagB/SusD family nutrient uptake outer membrane protein [Niastella populi]|uniref:RagB/SusD family nutrient uptake outer membrane protein n=1 Tax=Niastella populi TaxID=550983 RepID=UPI001A997FC2|nr:RagB/SusD family nutrient uptake outer membrane protein [Niastella populi]
MTDAKQTTLSYYKKPSEAYTALVGCFNGLNQIYNNDAIPALLEVFSDNSFGGTGTFDGYGWAMVDEFDKSISPSDVSFHSGGWKAYYQTIYRCNVLLENMDNVAWGDSTALRTQYAAEAKFIRAYCYLDLVRLFEKVPLVTTPTIANVPQAGPEETFTQIMTDLREASDSLPSANYKSVPGGRITKWAAESLLARAYLYYAGLYGKGTIGGETAATALTAVEDVIAHSGHSLVSDFTTLWPAASTAKNVAYAGEDNPEVVFAIKYSSTDNWSADATGNRWMVMEGIRSESLYPYQAGWGACTVDPKLYNLYPSTDTRRFATIISIADENLAYTKSADCREYTGYFMKKYAMQCDQNGNSIVSNFQTGQYQDFFVIRYSDVLLMAAELGSPNAVSYYNQVRLRADPSAAPAAAVSEAEILAERRLEFAGEGLRYWDLLRQGIDVAASTIAANTTVSYFQDGTSNPPTASKFEANIKATRGFQQIPNDQITLSSGTLKQNAGW